MENTIKLLPEFTETTSTINSFIPNEPIEYIGHDEEWEWKQLTFNTDNEYNYSQAMEYDSMNENDYDDNPDNLSRNQIHIDIDDDLPF
jgi:hypothetical protein